jgi:leucyl aminopeptidase
MQISSSVEPLHEVAADWLVLGVFENEPLPAALADLDVRVGSLISRVKSRGDWTGKLKELTPLWDVRGINVERILLVGLGPRDQAGRDSLAVAGAAAARSLTGRQYQKIVIAVPEGVPGLDTETVGVALGTGFYHGSEGPGLRKSKPGRFPPRDVTLHLPGGGDILRAIEKRVDVEGRAVSLARELVNLPPNEKYPELLAARAQKVAQATGLECIVLDEKQLADERMNSLLAVAQGSDRPARVVVLRYRRVREGKLLGLVGKGVTFDSGGLSLKTNDQMVDMKCDMAGAATVLAAMQAIAELGLPVNVIGLMALVENLPSGKAMKLGDVLTARSGKTIEVLNTDAEGRLILADVLNYAVDQRVDHLVDLATLTGACMVALGNDVAGLFSNNASWAGRVASAAAGAGEKAWELPMFPHYGDMIKGDVADIRNTGGTRYAGAITAAKFLEEFVSGVPWVHLDIAGPAYAEKDSSVRESGGTGCFVRTLVELARTYNMA